MYLLSIKSVKHNGANSVNWSILKKSRQIGFGVFIVHLSMGVAIGLLGWPALSIRNMYFTSKTRPLNFIVVKLFTTNFGTNFKQKRKTTS